ncbi:MAG: metalloregulator ArsR/SmtB family transcription factor [Candidatus Gastranaerophilales bacterium]|nr:metalloregulator ArsR/SmtB family transcription factor [Candidatus Gastranaerophilales bacterium]
MINKEINCESESNNGVGKIRKKMPDTEILYELADFFKVMGDGTRIRILWALEDDEMCAGDLAVLLDMTQSAISHQLKVLRMSKLVKIRKSGKNVYYSLDDNHVKMILKKSLEHVKE